MSQLSLLPILEPVYAAPMKPLSVGSLPLGAPMAPSNRPTPAQIAYLKRLTGIRTDSQLARYVLRKLGERPGHPNPSILTRRDFAQVIDWEVSERRWAN